MNRKNYLTMWELNIWLEKAFNILNADLALFRLHLFQHGMNILNDVDMIGPHDILISREQLLACCCHVVRCDMPKIAWEHVK